MKVQPFTSPEQSYPHALAAGSAGTSFDRMLETDHPAAGDRARSFLESGLFGKSRSAAGEGARLGSSIEATKAGDGAAASAAAAANTQPPKHDEAPNAAGPRRQPTATGRSVEQRGAKLPARLALRTYTAMCKPLAASPEQAAGRSVRRGKGTKRGGNAAGIQLLLDEDEDRAGLVIATSDPGELPADAQARLAAILSEHGLTLGRLTINGHVYGKDDGHGT